MKVNWNTTLHAITACATVLIAVTALLAFGLAERHIEQSEQQARIEHLEARLSEYESPGFVDAKLILTIRRTPSSMSSISATISGCAYTVAI
jgi:hypothetical protein